MSNENLERSVVFIDFHTLKRFPPEKQPSNKKEILCYCPECINKVGKPDKKGKLYLSSSLNAGFCQRCKTIFKPEELRNDDIQKGETKFAKRIANRISDMAARRQRGSVNNYTFTPIGVREIGDLDKDRLDYLYARNPYLIQLKDVLGLRGYYGDLRGIYTPMLYNGQVSKYQLRYLDWPEKAEDKYYTSPGPKFLYSPRHLLFDTSSRIINQVTLCEGVFDAIALEIMGYPNVFALLGSDISWIGKQTLRKFMPSWVYIAMDTDALNKSIEADVKKLPSVSRTIHVSFEYPAWYETAQGDVPDPEEYLRIRSQRDVAFRSKCNVVVNDWATVRQS